MTACPRTGLAPNGLPVSCNTAIDAFGLPTDFVDPNDANAFGASTSFRNNRGNADFSLPREYRLTVGFRF